MAGIYIHIPFCRQACRYCDFYFTVSLKQRDAYIGALLLEIEKKAGAWRGVAFDTLYFGGGTPSVISIQHLSAILKKINEQYILKETAEITLEANPDDLNRSYLRKLKGQGIKRLSIGVQSFREADLELMRRSHDSKQATDCIQHAAEEGFNNINMDLIYGLPGLSTEAWEENVKKAMNLPVQHISAYHLTYEPGTIFHHWKSKGKLKASPEETSLQQYEILREACKQHGYEHYEISNFAKEGMRSRHNTSYWSGEPYLGLGPGAHSFRENIRSWNLSSIKKYIEAMDKGGEYYEEEYLSAKDRYHDYLITSLRRKEGMKLAYLRKEFGEEVVNYIERILPLYLESNAMQADKEFIRLTPEGWLTSDAIIEKLMVDTEALFENTED